MRLKLRNIYYAGFVAMAVWLYPLVGYSAPSITSTSVDASTLTIVGTGFGSKEPVAPLRWENFEDGKPAATIDTTGYWSMKTTGDIRPVFSIDYPRHGGSILNIKHNNWAVGTNNYDPPHGMAQFWRNNIGFAKTKKAFVSLWTRFDWGPGGATDTVSPGYQIKLFRILKNVYDTSGNMTYPAISNFNWYYGTGVKASYYAPYGNQTYINTDPKFINNMSDQTKMYSTSGVYGDKVWFNIQLQYSASSSSGAANATLKVWTQKTDGTGYILKDVLSCPGYSCSFDSPNPTNYANEIMDALKVEYNFDNFEDNPHPEITSYTDDIYVDNSWARIEIGDASTYESCTHREMQVPVTWGTGSITAKLNLGSFKNTDKLYVYVVDENGTVNVNGHLLTLSNITAPKNVTGTVKP